jgi:hypothetical protein
MGINYFYGHFEGGGRIRDILCHGIKIKKHQKLIYSTELRLKTIKN